MQQQTGSARSYELLLIAVIAARATSFIFSKMILESLAPFNLLAVRFIIAFVLLALIFNKAVRSLAVRDLLAGTVIGTAFFYYHGVRDDCPDAGGIIACITIGKLRHYFCAAA